jgi:hypothetical protein
MNMLVRRKLALLNLIIQRIIDYALSYGSVHVADILYDKQFYRKTVVLGPIVKIARNAGATIRV